MNWGKGLRRTLLVYLGLCIIVGLAGWAIWDKANADWLYFARDAKVPYDRTTVTLLISAQKRIDLGLSVMFGALFAGMVVPIAVAILTGLGWWIWRGFKPKAQSRNEPAQ